MPSPPPQPSLHYQPPPHRRRHWRARWVIMFAITIALFIFSKQAPHLWRRAQLLYWQRQCLNSDFPPRQVVADLLRFPKLIGNAAAPWQSFYSRFSPPGLRSDGTVFLHELISPSGHRRLVAVDMLTVIPGERFATKIIVPGTIASDPTEVITELYGNYIWYPPSQVMAATLDPTDSSHFSFQVTDKDHSGHFDGWLQDDDRVHLEYHSAASTQPAPSIPAQSP